MECRECNSSDIEYFKAIFVNRMEHFIMCCNTCYFRTYTAKTPEVEKIVWNQDCLEGDALKRHSKEWKAKRKAFLKGKINSCQSSLF